MEIKILEQICWGGSKLAPIVDKALNELQMDTDFDIISDMVDILTLGVMSTPALMINGKIVSSGRVPTVEEVKQSIEQNK